MRRWSVYPVDGERSIDIAAPPERVWALVTNIGRMGEWSPHTVLAQWVDTNPADGPARGVEEALRRLKAAAEAS